MIEAVSAQRRTLVEQQERMGNLVGVRFTEIARQHDLAAKLVGSRVADITRQHDLAAKLVGRMAASFAVEPALAGIPVAVDRVEQPVREAANNLIVENAAALLAWGLGGVAMLFWVNLVRTAPDAAEFLTLLFGLPLAVLAYLYQRRGNN